MQKVASLLFVLHPNGPKSSGTLSSHADGGGGGGIVCGDGGSAGDDNVPEDFGPL